MPARRPRNGARTSGRRSIKKIPQLSDVLRHLGNAVALAETVNRALDAAADDMELSAVGDAASALKQTVQALRAVYDELDMAIPAAARA